MRNNKISLLLTLLITTSLFGRVADKFKIDIGSMYVTNYETNMQIGREGIPIGAKINTDDQLGLNNQTRVLRIDGHYRFTDVHSIDFSYFGVKSDSKNYVEKEFEWDGNRLSDVMVGSYFNMDIYKVNYAYSFYHNDRVELSLIAGLHITAIELGLSASGKINDEPNEKFSSGADVTVPLPVFGFKAGYAIIPEKLFVHYKAEYLYLQFDVYKGAFVNNTLSFEYHFLENYGVGLGFDSNTIVVETQNGSRKVDVENNLSGISLFLTYFY